MHAIEIVIVPASNPGTYWPVVDGKRLTRATRQPFFDGARALLANGVSPDVSLVSRHEGSPTIAMQSTVGEAARWSVSESDRGGLQRRLWKPFDNGRHSQAGNSSGDDDGLEGNSLPDAPPQRRCSCFDKRPPSETCPTCEEQFVEAMEQMQARRTMALNGERKPLPQSDCQDEHPRGGISHDPDSKIAARFAGAQSDFGKRLVPRHMPPVDPTIEAGDVA